MTDDVTKVDQGTGGVLFQALLRQLSQGSEPGEAVYEKLRARLIAFLRLHLPAEADALADLTLDRLAQRIHSGTAIQNVYSYALGIARMVVFEARARFSREQSSVEEAAYLQQALTSELDTAGPDPEAMDAALRGCLERLGAPAAELILEYYVDSGANRIEARRRLAQRLGLSINALRNRALRVRAALEACVREKLPLRDGWGPADTSDEPSKAPSP
jgi:DNA-directed RNA polymerase specialized sigma24 family protein